MKITITILVMAFELIKQMILKSIELFGLLIVCLIYLIKIPFDKIVNFLKKSYKKIFNKLFRPDLYELEIKIGDFNGSTPLPNDLTELIKQYHQLEQDYEKGIVKERTLNEMFFHNLF